jgi:hypothetical protein
MLLAYQYLQTLPQIANGPGNTMWMIPSELTSALKALSTAFDSSRSAPETPSSHRTDTTPRAVHAGGPALTSGTDDDSTDAALAEVKRNVAALEGEGAADQSGLAAAIAGIPEVLTPPEVALPTVVPEADPGANGAAGTA